MKIKSDKSISENLTQWLQRNDWYQISADTNRLRLESQFGPSIETIARQLEYHQKPKLRRQVLDCWDHLSAKCMKIDVLCRAGCTNPAERMELDFLRCKTIAAGCELAEVLDLITGHPASGNGNFVIPAQDCHPGPGFGIQMPETGGQWVSFREAADLLLVSKSTVCRWVKEGKLTVNNETGRQKKISKTSVLLAKQAREDQDLLQDARDLRNDARKIDF